MHQLLKTAVAVLVGLGTLSAAEAGHHHRRHHHRHHHHRHHHHKFSHHKFHHPGHHFHGKRAHFGYYYAGKFHTHWKHRYWSPKHGCWLYHDPFLHCDYYFCVPDNCYYPVSYCPYGCFAW